MACLLLSIDCAFVEQKSPNFVKKREKIVTLERLLGKVLTMNMLYIYKKISERSRNEAFRVKRKGNCSNFPCVFLFSFLLLVFCTGELVAQQDCDFRAQVETREGTCFNNCMFIYRLVDEHGVVINSRPDNLTEVRLYYMKLNESDTIYSPHYEGGEDTVFLMAGTYVVGMEGLCELGPGNRHIIRTVDTMTLVTTYRVPTAPVINQVATSVDGIGTHPTLSCGNTGSVQLKIEGGRMPFYVNVVNESGDDTLKTVVFENPMYDGNDESKYNYKDYYTVDSLPAGTWRFYVRDACHYGMAVTVETVTTVQPPLVNAIDVYASTGNAHLTDSNVVKIRANMNYQYVYYIQELCNFMTYRIFKAGSSVNDDSWKPFPCASSDRIVLYDTLDVQNYCEVMNPGDSIHFQFRLNMEGCKDTIVDRYFHYNKPNKDKFDYKKVMEQLDLRKVGEPCEYGYWSYTKEVSIKYHSYQPDNANPNDDHGEYRYHYTSPLTWTYVDKFDENDTIKKDTIRHLGESTSLTLEEAGFTLDSLDNSTVHSVKREVRAVLVDAHGCPLYEAKHEFIYELKNEDAKPTFEVTNTEGNHCCEDPRSITVKTSGILKDSVIIDTIMLIQSPLGNRYNLIATFNRSILTWVVRPLTNQIQNTTTVDALYKFGEPDGKSFTISGNCLPSGPYKFVIKTQCGSDTIVHKIGFQDVYIVGIKDMPVHNVTHECAYMYVTYSQGQFEIRKSNQDKNTGEPLPPTVTNLSTKFQVVSGPAGGYDKNTKYAIGDAPLRFSLPGTYVVKMFPENSKDVCEDSMYVFDTIVHRGAILDLEYVGALKCKEGDTEGNVYISGIYGTPPYTYTLYDTADLGGHVVVSVKVREDGTFETIEAGNVGIRTNGVGVVIGNVYDGVEGVPMRTGKELSCMIEDSCGTYFYVNFFPQTLATMQKVWFDNDLREAVVCEGDSVQVHALEYGSFFRYEWTTSSGTPVSTVANPYLSIPRESQEGVYYVTISGHGCSMTVKDSIHLVIKESPSIQLSVTLDQDTVVCPGSTVSITVVPHSNMSDSVRFSLAFSNEKGEEIRNYVGSDVPMPIDYTVLYPTYIYSVAVEDEECGFHHPEDSVEIKTNTKDMLTNCSLMTRWDTVCAGSAAELFARDTVTPPYTLQWYHDYELTSLAQEEVINSSEYWSSYHTAALAEDTTMYVRVLKEGRCPSHQMIATEVHNIADGHQHRINCNEVLRLYDTGGPEGNYSIGEEVTASFRSGDHRPISLHFEELDLSVTSVLYVISGTEVVADSLLYILRYGMDIPDVIVSRGDALTLYFTAGDNTASGWNALIQTAGSVAVAKVNKPVYTIFSDEVCQRQSGIYDDPYRVVGEIVTADTISKIVKQAGTYLFAKTYSRELPLCDSTVSFQLTVRHPDYKTPVNVITTTLESNYPYEWYGQEYNETGQYLHPIDGEGGDCDVIDVLNLVVLEINDFTGQLEICKGEEATLKVSIITPTLPPIFTQLHRVGDVLCTDNTIMHPDSFLLSGKSAKGVVFYLDPDNNNKGKAIALRDAYEGMNGRGELPSRFQGECIWAIGGKNPATNKENYESIHACRLYGKVGEAVYDMKGWGNTDTIRKTTYNLAGIDTSTATASQMNNAFKKYAPAAYYCYYYNVDSARAMKGVREKDTEGGNISPIPSGWYLPSIGEMNLYFVNRREVSRTLEKLQNTPHNAKLMQGRIDVRQNSSNQYRHDESYWTSTEYNNQEAYRLSGKGQMIYNKTDYKKNISTNNPSFVRAIIEF